ncbi:AfsR/SARP family transcriptional regulator [Actinokineospora fastidiosa]|uniref:SARP family transcriptional regulator n=1 Tax=Actinokineospora fastidiosa TaxID=1816 RepID=A0A918GKD3_9PSEU|nr:BTAD domain-containing putative transcriptional regulator [Actinokineospora fastidiosa]GGS42431.1 SARP family transcriptional regulator [Actinokineospora fastidiosa]
MRVRVLGPLQVVAGEREVPVSAARSRKVLAALALAAGQPVSLDRLIDAVWQADPPATAAKQIRNTVSDLRRLLAATAAVPPTPTGYRLAVETDVGAFAEHLARARAHAAEGRDADAAGEYRAALAQWRGPALADVAVPALAAQVAGLTEQRLVAMEECVELELALGAPGLVRELTALVAEHPLRERFAAQLMTAHLRDGAHAEALTVYETVRRALAEELGIDPGPRLRGLHARILADDRPAPVPARCDLPADATHFTGREAELRRLLDAAGGGGAVAISAIDGMAGVGKTALAVHTAYRLMDRYPDAQLFIDLHAHTPGRDPLPPQVALDKLLRAIGVPGERVPDDVEDRAALWRAELARLRAVIVLDNAADAEQIRSLLPGRSASLALVTSRQRLTSLDNVCLVSLDVLPPQDARALFAGVVGHERVGAEPDAVDEVLRRCGYLPLAIRIAASRLRHRPSWTVAHLAARLGELPTGVAAAFALSYRHLSQRAQRLFRLLGLIPGPDIDLYAAAALAGHRPEETTAVLDELVDAHLLQEPLVGRFRFHDLLRSYAAESAAGDDRRGALTRLFDFYLHTASAAMDTLAPTEKPHRPSLPPYDTPRPALTEYQAALRWLRAENANLVAVADAAAADGWHRHACHLSSTLWRYFHVSGKQNDALALHAHALTAARAAGDRLLEAETLASLGYVGWWLGRYREAITHCRAAVAVARETGNLALEGRALHALGLVHCRLEQHAEAHAVFTRMMTVALDSGDRILEAYALRGLGDVHNRLGEHGQALSWLGKALSLAEETGNRSAEGFALNGLGDVHRRIGDHATAADYQRRALTTAKQTGNRNVEIRALNGLGELPTTGYDQAIGYHRRALALAETVGDRFEQARAHQGLAGVYRALRYADEERRHADAARDLYTDLGIRAPGEVPA